MRVIQALLVTTLLLGSSVSQPEVTGPRSERVQIPSKALGTDVAAMVHLPQGYAEKKDTRYPVIFFLHGAGRGSERTWESRGTNKTVQELIAKGRLMDVIIVCPGSRGMSFWINWKDQAERRYGDFVTQEMPAWAEKNYRIRKGRQFRALMGDSMGGFGALVNALRRPQAFGSVSAHEPSIYPEDRSKLPSWISRGRRGRGGLLGRIFGEPIDEKHWLTHNVFAIVKKAKPGAFKDLPIYFDVGTFDRYGLAEPCKAWNELLQSRKIEHTFKLRDAGHGRRFFEDSVPDSLAFHGKVFKKALQAAKGN